MSPFQLEINNQGYLVVPKTLAEQLFPEDVCVTLWREPELWVLPIRSANSGGLLMKQRNSSGDRSVLIWENLPPDWQSGFFSAFWDGSNGALRIALQK